MRLGRRFVFLAMIMALLGGLGSLTASAARAATAPESGDGFVRCANLSPGSPVADIYLIPFDNSGQQTVLRHVNYGEVYSYMPVSPGQYSVAIRPAGAAASSPPVVSTNFMVAAGTDYTVASIGSSTARRVVALQDQKSAPKGSALLRVFQASLKQHLVTVSDGSGTLASQLAFGSATSYMTVKPGTQTIKFSAPGDDTSMSVTLAPGSVHTIVVLDGSSGLEVDTLTDAASSAAAPAGGAATGFGGMAPHFIAGQPQPWLATLAGGLLLIAFGIIGLRRSRRTATVRH
ncbi:MAG: DUF4397 domain-containing protein [Streptosporangiaceae bacterium]